MKMTESIGETKLNCPRCRREVTPVQKMGGQICPLCRIILEPVQIAEVKLVNNKLTLEKTDGPRPDTSRKSNR
jgi:hypothetical protein